MQWLLFLAHIIPGGLVFGYGLKLFFNEDFAWKVQEKSNAKDGVQAAKRNDMWRADNRRKSVMFIVVGLFFFASYFYVRSVLPDSPPNFKNPTIKRSPAR